MIGPGMELEHIRGVLAKARRVRDTATSHDAIDCQIAPLLLKCLSEVIQISEALLAEREQMESRLHRTPLPAAPPTAGFGERP